MNALKRIVVTWLATARGGAEKSSLELCQTIRRRYQAEVTLVLWHYGEAFDFSAFMQSDGGEVINCYDGDEYRRRLAEALAVNPASTALLSNHRTYQNDLHLADQRGVKCATLFRQTPMDDEALRTLPSPTASELAYRRGAELDWGAMRRAVALIGLSDFSVRELTRFAPQHPRIVRIYNGPNMPGSPGENAAITPRPLRRFLIVSRLIGWKAVDFGITAFSHLLRRYPDVRLQIAGDGEEELRLRQLVDQLGLREQVEFLGFKEDIQQVYQANDCLLHLSGMESFGRVVIEATACGLPAVVPQSAGTGELIINEHTGLTFRPHDLADCVRAMECAYHLSGADYVRLGSTARRRAQALFNPDRLAEEYVGLANSMLVSG
ncbi:MAG: glycosyltransferase family 4 protein [Blastocatellales bacterium]